MANDNLKHAYDNSNKVTDSGLSVTYRQSFNGQYWEITRIAKKSYSFIGMDKDTAYECASVKRSQYTRAFARLDTSTIDEQHPLPSVVNAIECPSDIAPQHVDGDVWSVQISVNEEDTLPSAASVADPAELFAAANARNYDEDAGLAALTLGSASRSGDKLSFTYATEIAEFNADSLACQYKTSESSTSWTTAARDGSNPSPVIVPEDVELFVRLIYGSIESNTLTVPEEA